MANLVGLLKQEQKVLAKKLGRLETAIEALTGDVLKSVKRRNKMSEATKKKLSAAAKKRWAAIKKSTR